jgi:hypothetical protein
MSWFELKNNISIRVMWIDIIYRCERKRGASRTAALKKAISRR